MKIFKFGGASVKDAEGVKNVKNVLEFTAEKDLVVVVSAMGKMTNALEEIVKHYFANNTSETEASISEVYNYHLQILKELFPNASHGIYRKVSKWFEGMRSFIENNKSKNHAFVYDQIVSYGELISTTIVSEYLNENGLKNEWLDE